MGVPYCVSIVAMVNLLKMHNKQSFSPDKLEIGYYIGMQHYQNYENMHTNQIQNQFHMQCKKITIVNKMT
jgi:hypothetical protein